MALQVSVFSCIVAWPFCDHFGSGQTHENNHKYCQLGWLRSLHYRWLSDKKTTFLHVAQSRQGSLISVYKYGHNSFRMTLHQLMLPALYIPWCFLAAWYNHLHIWQSGFVILNPLQSKLISLINIYNFVELLNHRHTGHMGYKQKYLLFFLLLPIDPR